MSDIPVHVLPINDAIEHVLASTCWCRPTLDNADTGETPVWVHHSADGRERNEPDAPYPAAQRH